jgi:flagellin
MKALATAAASGNVTDAQRTADLNTEYQQLIKEIDGISSGTRYSGNSLLDGTAVPDWTAGVDFIVGTSSTDKITVTIPKTTSTSLAIGAGDITTAANAVTAMGALTTAINTVTGTRAAVGALESQFSFHSQSIATTTENTSAAASAIMDADVASEKSQLSSADVKTQASVAALAQANKMPQELLSLLQG